MVLDEVWRTLDGVDSLSNPQGGPLSRTVKLILDPLVIRPVQNPQCGGPMVSADGAAAIESRLSAARDVLRATAEWFTLLKRVRRSLQIVEGNPQDLYFQRCYELAVTAGRPDPARTAPAEQAIREIHDTAAGRTTQALKDHLTDPRRITDLARAIETGWRRRNLRTSVPIDDEQLISTVLDGSAGARLGADTGTAEKMFDELIAEGVGTHRGIQLWTGKFDSDAAQLGLTTVRLPPAPRLGTSAAKATLALPFDRTVFERVFTVLQASSERSELPPIPDLVRTEITRSCSPWALLDESLRVTATIGAQLALGLRPIQPHLSPDDDPSLARRVINSRWRREAYVLQARRLVVCDDEDLPADNPLAVIAAELRTPWRAYIRRLWVRLHGRDVREANIYDVEELWDLLDGVARSVILDHRMRVKRALGASPDADALEPRAS